MTARCADKSKQTTTPPSTITWLSVDSIQPDVFGRRCWTNIFYPKFLHVPLGVGGWPLGYEERRCGLIVRAISSKMFSLCGHDLPTSQTDGQTVRQTTCDRKVAYCTIVHRASTVWWSWAMRFSSYASWQANRQTDKQTNRHTHHNTSHPSDDYECSAEHVAVESLGPTDSSTRVLCRSQNASGLRICHRDFFSVLPFPFDSVFAVWWFRVRRPHGALTSSVSSVFFLRFHNLVLWGVILLDTVSAFSLNNKGQKSLQNVGKIVDVQFGHSTFHAFVLSIVSPKTCFLWLAITLIHI